MVLNVTQNVFLGCKKGIFLKNQIYDLLIRLHGTKREVNTFLQQWHYATHKFSRIWPTCKGSLWHSTWKELQAGMEIKTQQQPTAQDPSNTCEREAGQNGYWQARQKKTETKGSERYSGGRKVGLGHPHLCQWVYLFDIVASLCAGFNEHDIQLLSPLLSLLCGDLSARPQQGGAQGQKYRQTEEMHQEERKTDWSSH